MDVVDAVVIGSGFGGAVSACRLAQAGFKVAIIERGRRYRGDFPRNISVTDMNGWFWQESADRGLFDVKCVEEIQILQAAGWGGGSLIYANVQLRALPEVFAAGWPAGYSREALDPYYDLVASMLEINPITVAPGGVPNKTVLMEHAARSLARSEFCHPNLAVRFGEKGAPGVNKFGVSQTACNFCGECVIGCNSQSKNTLDLNYLTLAERHGARALTECQVTAIEPHHEGYLVTFRDHQVDADRRIAARYVFLCAGAVNSTELLLRCRQSGKLPKLGDRLGANYSGNGDQLAFAVKTKKPFTAWHGPTITSGIVFDRQIGDRRVWFILEEGGFPKQLSWLAAMLTQSPSEKLGSVYRSEVFAEVGRLFRGAASVAKGEDAAHIADDHIGVFLAMGGDRANGRITLGPLDNLWIKWELAENLPLYNAQQQLATDIAKTMGGEFTLEPFWRTLRLPLTVHSLGGCVMSDDEDGVTTATGELRGYPGFYVMDGSILPGATGVNPAHTIAAVAERNIETFIRKRHDHPHWQAPERAAARPILDPVSRLYPLQAGCTVAAKAPVLGLTFKAPMQGHYTLLSMESADLHASPAKATTDRRSPQRMRIDLTVVIDHLNAFLIDKQHTASARGTMHIAGYTADGGAVVVGGTFNIVAAPNPSGGHHSHYHLPFYGADNRPLCLDLHRDIRLIKDLSQKADAIGTARALLREGHGPDGQVLAEGELTCDLLQQVASYEITGASSLLESLEARARYASLILGWMWAIYEEKLRAAWAAVASVGQLRENIDATLKKIIDPRTP